MTETSSDSARPIFEIATFVVSRSQYAEMRASFEIAGFRSQCKFTAFDNSAVNSFDPYRTITHLWQSTTADYLIFCHEDVRVDPVSTPERLLGLIAEISKNDQTWAALGNAGIGYQLEEVDHIDDPRSSRRISLPYKAVITLDENFLVLNPRLPLRLSEEISGFHLYGSDICLSAQQVGRRCYVIPFLLRHLSSGNSGSPAFRQAAADFQRVWYHKMHKPHVCIFRTPCVNLDIGDPHSAVFRLLTRNCTRQALIHTGLRTVPQGSLRVYARVLSLLPRMLWYYVTMPRAVVKERA